MNTTSSIPDAVIEILTLSLKPGTRHLFHQIYTSQALPLLKKWNFHVIDYGPSQHDDNTYYVIRAFASVKDRQQDEDAYYQSMDWREGPRSTILSMIEHDAYTVVPASTIQVWSGKLSGNRKL